MNAVYTRYTGANVSHVHTRPYRGRSNEWTTPPEILEALGPFDDDPALPGRTDGLDRQWHGFVWLNPPYGPETGQWLKRLADYGHGIALVFARTETQWFVEQVWKRATAMLFLSGRPHFWRNGQRAKGNSGGPLVLIAYGSLAVERLRTCGLPGFLAEEWT